MQPTKSLLPINIEILVIGFTLAEAHHLHVSNEQFHLIISYPVEVSNERFHTVIVHLCHTDKGKMIKGFRFSVRVVRRQLQGLACIVGRAVQVTVMVGIGLRVETVYASCLGICARHKP